MDNKGFISSAASAQAGAYVLQKGGRESIQLKRLFREAQHGARLSLWESLTMRHLHNKRHAQATINESVNILRKLKYMQGVYTCHTEGFLSAAGWMTLTFDLSVEE